MILEPPGRPPTAAEAAAPATDPGAPAAGGATDAVAPPADAASAGLPVPAPARARPSRWTRRRLLVGSGVLLLLGLLVATLASRAGSSSAPAQPPPTATPAALIAHGQVLPARQARVAAQAGGVVRDLPATVGAQVAEQAPLARVEGPAAAEVVTAPFAGTVTNVLVHAGDTVTPGAALAVVADLRTLRVETSDVDQFVVGHVRAGQAVDVSVDAVDGLVLHGVVASVAGLPQADAGGGQTYPVVVTVGSLPEEVRAGMTVRVTFPGFPG